MFDRSPGEVDKKVASGQPENGWPGVAEFYRIAVGMWSIQPSEFWAMCLEEWWWMYDARIGEPKIGGIPESQLERLYSKLG